MKVYQDITLLESPEIPLHFLWEKIFQQVHLALVEQQKKWQADIGVSFPNYGAELPLGNKLRLLAKNETLLQQLDLPNWLIRLSDYCHCSSIKAVPSVTQYACFSRKQFDTNAQRLARRRAKRKGESLQQAQKHFSKFVDKKSSLPFIYLESLSSGTDDDHKRKRFRLFIELKLYDAPKEGRFNCYGLSTTTTVPYF